jgi:hypothetical protein
MKRDRHSSQPLDSTYRASLVETSQLLEQFVDPRPVFLLRPSLHHGIVQILDAPPRVGGSRHHRGRGRQLPALARTTQTPADDVKGHLEGYRCGQVRQFLAEPHREPREAFHEGPQGRSGGVNEVVRDAVAVARMTA